MRGITRKFARAVTLLGLTTIFVGLEVGVSRAGVLFQGYFKGVPTPGPGQSVDFWWDHIAKQAKMLRQAGFTAILLPSPLKAKGGTFSDGFDPFDDYDLGSKDQRGTIPTRF